MRSLLNLPHRLHQRILHRNRNIATRVALAQLRQLAIVLALQARLGVADGDLEHGRARGDVRQRDVHAALEAAADGGVELPRDVGRAQHQHARRVLAHAVHLHQHLGLDAPRRLGLAFAARAAERVDLIDEDDGGVVFAGHVEELFDESVQGWSLLVLCAAVDRTVRGVS